MRFCNGQSSICLSLQNSQELLVLLEFVRFQWNELICSELNCLWTSLTSEWILILIFSANVWLTWSLVNVLMIQSANLVDGLKPPAWSCVDLPWGQLTHWGMDRGPLRVTYLSGTRMLPVDPLGPLSCGPGPPRIGLVLVHNTDAWSDWDPGSLHHQCPGLFIVFLKHCWACRCHLGVLGVSLQHFLSG